MSLLKSEIFCWHRFNCLLVKGFLYNKQICKSARSKKTKPSQLLLPPFLSSLQWTLGTFNFREMQIFQQWIMQKEGNTCGYSLLQYIQDDNIQRQCSSLFYNWRKNSLIIPVVRQLHLQHQHHGKGHVTSEPMVTGCQKATWIHGYKSHLRLWLHLSFTADSADLSHPTSGLVKHRHSYPACSISNINQVTNCHRSCLYHWPTPDCKIVLYSE